MTALTVLWNPSATSDAVMRAAFKAYSDLLTAVGVIKTADTGQIDLATAVAPGTATANTFVAVGYEVRRLQAAGRPDILLKFTYGIVASTISTIATYRTSIQVQVGISSDGSGTLDGVNMTQLVSFYSSTSGPSSSVSTTIVRPLSMASDGQNYLSVINDPNGIAFTSGVKYGYLNFALERSVNASTGAYDAEAVISFNPFSQSTLNVVQVLNFVSGTAAAGGPFLGYQIPSTLWTTSGSLTQATIMPVTVCVPTPKGPARATLLAFVSDVTPGGQYQVNMYGALVTYMAAGVPYDSTRVGGITASAVNVLLRFD